MNNQGNADEPPPDDNATLEEVTEGPPKKKFKKVIAVAALKVIAQSTTVQVTMGESTFIDTTKPEVVRVHRFNPV